MWSRLLASVVFLACAAIVFWYALVHTVHRGTIAVPEVRGETPADAVEMAHDLGLSVAVEDMGVFSAQFAVGAIATQEPHPGYHVKAGSTIRVWLSMGAERATIPNLAGESIPAALRSLEQLSLLPGKQVQIFGHAAGDSVVATDPPAGTEVPPGREVSLLVNLTPEQELWVMPSLLNQPLQRVSEFCRANRLRLGQVHRVPYLGLPSAIVLRQYPLPGSPLSRSDVITLWVSE